MIIRSCIVFILMLSSLSALAQAIKPERRIYMLDATSSMEKLKTPDNKILWKVVTKSLCDAINSVDDPNTEIVVVPFWEKILDVWEVKATDIGKKEIIAKIENLSTGGQTTNISGALSKGYDLLAKDRVNYLFLLTDGTHNTPNTTDPVKVIQDWSKSFDNKESYGFYVMLHRDAKNDNIVSAVKSNPEMWVVESADINVNILRFNGVINFNPRIDNAIKLPVSGPYKRVNSKIAEVKVSTNPYYQVKLINGDLQQGEVTIEVINKQPLSQTPDVYSLDITLITDSNDDFTYIIPASIRINCNNKKERVLKITPKE